MAIRNFSSTRVLVLGAGVTGVAIARSLKRRGALITIADDHVRTSEEFEILPTGEIDLSLFACVVVSPGWRSDHPLVSQAQELGLDLLNEVDIAWQIKCEIAPHQKWLALTGTNGKTSTVELAASMLRSGGIKAIACGNVGHTVIEAVESSDTYDYLVLELSSFQLHWMKEARFVASAILNIADDHVDWHGSFENYTSDKLSILDSASTAILNANDPVIVTSTAHWQGRKVFFTLESPNAGELGVVEDLLVDRAFVADPQEAALLCELKEIKPLASHTVANTLAASGLARAAGVAHSDIQKAIASFTPGRHRIELIHESQGIRWIDDSKATNPHAARASISASKSVIWIAGGLSKGAKMDDLIRQVGSHLKAAILIGTDRDAIAHELRTQAPHVSISTVDPEHGYEKGSSNNSFMEAIVKSAQSFATHGDDVLLAPACASMDQFVSYADRGDRFAQAVKAVIAGE